MRMKIRRCLYCGNPSGERVYCSKKCSVKMNSQRYQAKRSRERTRLKDKLLHPTGELVNRDVEIDCGMSITCSKCGMLAITHSLRTGE